MKRLSPLLFLLLAAPTPVLVPETLSGARMSQSTPDPSPKSPMEVTADPTVCRVLIAEMVAALNAGPRSRAASLAVTKLEEASMWLNEALRLS